MTIASPLRLRLDGAALVANWRALSRAGGSAACGAAVKADGYGLGVRAVVKRLAAAGCRDFFVATWAEALAIADLAPSVVVLHGVRAEDMVAALAAPDHVRPVLNSAEQVARWRTHDSGACDIMIDTGMNRLGMPVPDVEGLAEGLTIDTVMSHLACAEEDRPMNAAQRDAFIHVATGLGAARMSLANSAGIFLGADYSFDLTRPGLSLYGGVPVEAAEAVIQPVAMPQAQVIQRRRIGAGESVGYNATFTASGPTELAVLNIGYGDGYLRGFSGRGSARAEGAVLPVLGRVSMDLLIVDCTTEPALGEGDWVTIDYDLPDAARVSGLSQYELLTGLGARFDRVWN